MNTSERDSVFDLVNGLKKFLNNHDVDTNNCDFGRELANELDDWIARGESELNEEISYNCNPDRG